MTDQDFTGWRVGIDVGGTNTDAVVLDGDGALRARAKTPTTEDVSSGISDALDTVVGAVGQHRRLIAHVALGTTHATNAILERRSLDTVGVVRIGGPATRSVPPLSEWPADLRAAVVADAAIVDGGSEMTGEPIVPLDEEAIKRFLGGLAGRVDCVAIASVFSPVSSDHERRAAELAREILGDVSISLSHEIGSIGLLERENAAVLNASLVGVAHRVTDGLVSAMDASGLDAEAYIAQNDGTLMSLDYVQSYPVLTIGSGPTNSMRGAAYLTGTNDALVIDVGGTSTDIGVLVGGFPRESANPVEIGGVRTNFRMPDLVSVAIGGGTKITPAGDAIQLGPESVGYRLGRDSLIFGGDTMTLTDAAVATGRSAAIGDPDRVAELAPILAQALAQSDRDVEGAVDRAKISRRELVAVAVGGGSIVLPDELPGVAELHRPADYDVANAIGAAMALVSGESDRVYKLGNRDRQAVIDEAIELASFEAVRAGAKPDEIEVVEIDEVPLAYLTEPVARIRVKAAGPLAPRDVRE